MAIAFLTADTALIGEENLRSIAEVFSSFIRADVVEIEIDTLPPKEMRELNLQQRGIDSSTDVLSFPLLDSLADLTNDMPVLLGCIVICPEEAALRDETLSQLVVHGILHLLGGDHESSPEDWICMEHKALLELGIRGIEVPGTETW